MSDLPVLDRRPAFRPLETVVAAALLLLLLISIRDSLPQDRSQDSDRSCFPQSSENNDISIACHQESNRHNS
jgi:hypothetical protein